jgi:hypothetical protein
LGLKNPDFSLFAVLEKVSFLLKMKVAQGFQTQIAGFYIYLGLMPSWSTRGL